VNPDVGVDGSDLVFPSKHSPNLSVGDWLAGIFYLVQSEETINSHAVE
jgi:hypothetical protein